MRKEKEEEEEEVEKENGEEIKWPAREEEHTTQTYQERGPRDSKRSSRQ